VCHGGVRKPEASAVPHHLNPGLHHPGGVHN
jgi:hypothetical protein